MPYRDPAARRANAALYRQRNRERISVYMSSWKKRNRRRKTDARSYMRYVFYGVKNRRWEGDDLTIDDLHALYDEQRGRCALTGFIMTHSPGKEFQDTNVSIDRIDSLKGYKKGNVRLVCRRANVMRMDLSDKDLHEWCRMILFGPEEAWHVPDDYSVSI
jgi:hypothetical protein